jgi:hypothetical protein
MVASEGCGAEASANESRWRGSRVKTFFIRSIVPSHRVTRSNRFYDPLTTSDETPHVPRFRHIFILAFWERSHEHIGLYRDQR